MDKYEMYAVGHYLSECPEGWSYKQIIDELKSGDDGLEMSNHYHYDGIPPENMAELIDEMVVGLKRVF